MFIIKSLKQTLNLSVVKDGKSVHVSICKGGAETVDNITTQLSSLASKKFLNIEEIPVKKEVVESIEQPVEQVVLFEQETQSSAVLDEEPQNCINDSMDVVNEEEEQTAEVVVESTETDISTEEKPQEEVKKVIPKNSFSNKKSEVGGARN